MELTKDALASLIVLSYREGFKSAIAVLEGVLPELKNSSSKEQIEELLTQSLTNP